MSTQPALAPLYAIRMFFPPTPAFCLPPLPHASSVNVSTNWTPPYPASSSTLALAGNTPNSRTTTSFSLTIIRSRVSPAFQRTLNRRTNLPSTSRSTPRQILTVLPPAAKTGSSSSTRPPFPTDRHTVDWSALVQPYGDRIIERLETRFGFEGLKEAIQVRRHFTPADFETRYLAPGRQSLRLCQPRSPGSVSSAPKFQRARHEKFFTSWAARPTPAVVFRSFA